MSDAAFAARRNPMIRPLRLSSAICLIASAFLISPASAKDEPQKSFDIPAGPALDTLKEFAAQTGKRLLYSVDAIEGVSTNAVKGQFMPQQALDAMLRGTPLQAVIDEASGGFTIVRKMAAARPRAEQPPMDRPRNDPQPEDRVVEMEAFKVSTTIGQYHEESSSMATKVPTDLKELASSLQILNLAAISDRNAITLQDVYPYVIGMSQITNAVNGFTFRGFPNNGALTQNVEYDGLQGSVANSTPSAANVESIEFLKGPNSVLYGQMHPGGLLNIVTKSPKPVSESTVHLAVSSYAGSFNHFGSRPGFVGWIDSTGPIDKEKHWLYRVIVNAQDQRPFRPGDYLRAFSLYPSLTYQWSPQTEFTMKVELNQAVSRFDEGAIPIFTQGITYGPNARYFVTPFDKVYQEPTDIARDSGEGLSLFFRTQWGNNWTLRVQTRTVWHSDNSRGFSQQSGTVNSAGTLLTRKYAFPKASHRYNYFDVNTYGKMGSESVQQTLIVGVGGGYEFSNTERFAFGPNAAPISISNPILGVTPYPPDGTLPLSSRVTFTSLGEYVSDQIKIGQRLHVTVGTRHDQQVSHGIDVFNPVTSPYVHQFSSSETSQVGTVFDLTKPLAVYGSWSQSFTPTTVTNVDASGRSGFPPEKGEQFESGFKFETEKRDLFISLGAYYIRRTNVLVNTGTNLPTGQQIFRLDGGQIGKGVEFETEWQPVPHWEIQAGFLVSKTYIDKSITNPQSVGQDLVNAPRTSGSLWTRYNVPGGPLKGFGVGVGVIYTGQVWCGDPSTTTYFPVSGWTRVDTALYYKWKRYDLALNVQNIFDRRYISAARSSRVLVPGDPCKVTFSVTARF